MSLLWCFEWLSGYTGFYCVLLLLSGCYGILDGCQANMLLLLCCLLLLGGC